MFDFERLFMTFHDYVWHCTGCPTKHDPHGFCLISRKLGHDSLERRDP